MRYVYVPISSTVDTKKTEWFLSILRLTPLCSRANRVTARQLAIATLPLCHNVSVQAC
jgi:hypothetical protein